MGLLAAFSLAQILRFRWTLRDIVEAQSNQSVRSIVQGEAERMLHQDRNKHQQNIDLLNNLLAGCETSLNQLLARLLTAFFYELTNTNITDTTPSYSFISTTTRLDVLPHVQSLTSLLLVLITTLPSAWETYATVLTEHLSRSAVAKCTTSRNQGITSFSSNSNTYNNNTRGSGHPLDEDDANEHSPPTLDSLRSEILQEFAYFAHLLSKADPVVFVDTVEFHAVLASITGNCRSFPPYGSGRRTEHMGPINNLEGFGLHGVIHHSMGASSQHQYAQSRSRLIRELNNLKILVVDYTTAPTL